MAKRLTNAEITAAKEHVRWLIMLADDYEAAEFVSTAEEFRRAAQKHAGLIKRVT